MRSLKGFTLLNILLGILVLVLLMGLGYWKLNRYSFYYKVKDVAEKLYLNLEYARTLAFQRGSSKVYFETHQYYIYSPSTSPVPLRVISIPEGIEIIPNNNPIIFKQNKLPIVSATIRVIGGNYEFDVVISSISGRIYIKRVEK